ncbi:hypothetical protein VSVS12_02800 [Vibrio scophthalmi]|nr:hypothetical protein VSVS12_02800 [Vibrio scophthalmi]
MDIHQKKSECSGDVNIHCLLCSEAMQCDKYICEIYPPQMPVVELPFKLFMIDVKVDMVKFI